MPCRPRRNSSAWRWRLPARTRRCSNTSSIHKNHRPGIPLDMISYHFYATPAASETPEHWQYTFFNQADGFLNTVRYVEQIRRRLSPETRTTLDEIGSILPGDPAGKETIPEIYWNASGALYAYVYLEAMRMGIDIVGESQLVGYPTQFPSVSMVDWTTGSPNARFWVLKLIHDHFAPGRQTGRDTRRDRRRGGAGIRHAQGPRAAGGEQAQREKHHSAEGGMEGRGSVRGRFLRGAAHGGIRGAGNGTGAFRCRCDLRKVSDAPLQRRTYGRICIQAHQRRAVHNKSKHCTGTGRTTYST